MAAHSPARVVSPVTRLPARLLSQRITWVVTGVAALLLVASRGGLAFGQSGPDVSPPAAISDLKIIGTVYYVDRSNPSASDAGPGTEQVPWRTILHAVKTARAGETV